MKCKTALLLFMLVASKIGALSNAERWALALTEIMTVVNNDSHETLNFDSLNETNKNKYIELLKRDWGINNREELLGMLDKMETDGHSVALEKIKAIIIESKDYSIFNMVNTYKLSQKQYNYLKYALSNWGLLKDRRILVWDYGRNVALCRWGYDCGYLTESEAWEKIFYYAKKIQPRYSSWKDYGFDYYMGRIFWAAGFGSEMEYLFKTDNIYRTLVEENGYWSQLKWEEPLE